MSMKCVRMLDNSKIVRIPTGKADKLVNAGKASFVCKGIWKAYRKSLETVVE